MGEILRVLYWKSFEESTDFELNLIDWRRLHYRIIISFKLSIIKRVSMPLFLSCILRLIAFKVSIYIPISVGFFPWGFEKTKVLGFLDNS
jgi:hypothetical protein